ncbi:uncharacterized protein LOC113848126 [Abrus precatorius]|uniref:Uncharacterized protein LOC113848126 n=1 Tax=Abrus precatorius TaxID=3816 RepID=A0A8B8JPD2_ABRPR|nr:uncharacterized protein LOC113848126 [Abrus precatorius]
MDSAWQMQCDSVFESSTSATVSSAPSPEPRGQGYISVSDCDYFLIVYVSVITKGMNASHCLYPQVAHGLESKFVGGKQGLFYPSFPHSTTHGSSHANAGNSFLSLLYGPPSLLQGDFRELSDRKLYTSSGDCTPAIGNSVVDSIESGTVPSSSGGLITENLINCKLQSYANTSPEISSRAMVGLSSDHNFAFHNIQSGKTSTQPTVSQGEKAREFFSSSGQCGGASPASSLNVCCSDIQNTQHMALERYTSTYATSFMSGCPRVFCMGKSGYLLLSNIGLLGIVCSCHCCHMSVLKFCEHSGLHGVNPGDAVCMESGETISQWQKLYFSKFGQREHWMVILL